MKRHVVLALLTVAALAGVAMAEDPVYFADPNLKAAVEFALWVTTGIPVTDPTPTDMLALTWVGAPDKCIANLTGLEYAANIELINLRLNEITDISSLAGLTYLQELDLRSNNIVDISPLVGLTRLQELDLRSNNIVDISPLAGCIRLRELNLNSNHIVDVSPLSGLTRLEFLFLDNNNITDVSPLGGLTTLINLFVRGNNITDVSALAGLTRTSLGDLKLSNNSITDISSLLALCGCEYPFSPLHLSVDGNPLGRTAYCHDLQVMWDNCICPYFDAPNPNPPGGVAASDGTYTDNVRITWEALCPGPDGTDTFEYMVYRAASLGGAKEAISDWLGGTSFDDATAFSGQHYYYWVQSNHSTQFSNPDEGWCAVPERTLTISSTDGGSVSVPGEAAFTYDHGTAVMLVATPETNFHFVTWTGTAVDAGRVTNPNSASTTVTMDADYMLQANFAINRYRLTITCGEGGSVQTNVGLGGVWQTWGGEMSEVFDAGANVTITPVPQAGWHFTNWSGNLWSVDSKLRFILTADRDLTANFAPDMRELVVTSGEGGSVIVPGEGSFLYPPGTAVSVVAVADIGYRFAGWTGTLVDSDGVADPNASRIDVIVNEDGTLQANFGLPGTIIYVGQNPDPNSGAGGISASASSEDGSLEHPFGLIQQAIDAVGDGDAIFVLPGLYHENINFAGKQITVSSFDPNGFGAVSRTIIDGNSLGSVVTFEQGEDAGAVLAGFTILGGWAERGGGIRCAGASPTIANCLIVGNRADTGGGVFLSDSSAVLTNCTIADNYAEVSGGAISCTGDVLLVNSIVWGHVLPAIDADPNSGLLAMYSNIEGGWPGAGNIEIDPLFAQPGLLTIPEPNSQAVWTDGDYHLKSLQGRWDPAQMTWVQDAFTSPCIDAGNPCVRVKAELAPNGGRINMGAFGGTAEASRSP